MGITITSVGLREELDSCANPNQRAALWDAGTNEGRLRSGPNTLAWFLDGLAARLDPSLPERVFSQAVAAPEGPGDLGEHDCLKLADALERADEADMLACYTRADGDDATPGMKLACEVAQLVRRAAGEGGLAVL